MTATDDERRRLAEEVERLRAAAETAIGTLDDPTGGTHEQDMRNARKVLIAAINALDLGRASA